MTSALLLLALAFAPGIYLAVAIYGKDKYDREPKKIIFKAFILGGIAIFPAAAIEVALTQAFPAGWGLWSAAIEAFVIVALTEELCKFAMLRYHAYRLPEFNEPFDGIVYAVFVGLGFATAENLFYVLDGGWGVGVLRMFTSVPAHYAFAVIMGYYVGKAKFHPESRNAYMLRAIFYPTFIHGAYDFFILQKDFPALALFTIGVLFMAIRISKNAIAELQNDSIFRFRQSNPPAEVKPDEQEEQQPLC